ncbi:hypothetical protein KR222_002219 [Zaprionus bogoriensis]|nr:hypothetical protein KR222_002219 [Zaprionus bogoriensis]
MLGEELDIYDDLDDFQAAEDKKSKELQAWESKYESAQVEAATLREQNKALEKKLRIMEVNFQNLLDTAKAEIKRKDTLITQLRKEKDDICFRRKKPSRFESAHQEPRQYKERSETKNTAQPPWHKASREANQLEQPSAQEKRPHKETVEARQTEQPPSQESRTQTRSGKQLREERAEATQQREAARETHQERIEGVQDQARNDQVREKGEQHRLDKGAVRERVRDREREQKNEERFRDREKHCREQAQDRKQRNANMENPDLTELKQTQEESASILSTDANELVEQKQPEEAGLDCIDEVIMKVESTDRNPRLDLSSENHQENNEEPTVHHFQAIAKSNTSTENESEIDLISKENNNNVKPIDCTPDDDVETFPKAEQTEKGEQAIESNEENVDEPIEDMEKLIVSDASQQSHAESKQEANESTSDGEEEPTATTPKKATGTLQHTESNSEDDRKTPEREVRLAQDIQIIEDIRLPVKMNIEHIAVRVDRLSESHEEQEQIVETPTEKKNNAQVEEEHTVQSSLAAIPSGEEVNSDVEITTTLTPKSTQMPAVVMYAQPDSTKIDHNDEESAAEADLKSLNKPDEPITEHQNISHESDNIERALEQLHQHSQGDIQPDEATVTSTSMKAPKDLIKILTQSPVHTAVKSTADVPSDSPYKAKSRAKKVGARTASERKKANTKCVTPERQKKIKLMSPPADDVVPQTPPRTAAAAPEPTVQDITIDETLNESALQEQSSCNIGDTSVVTKRCSLGNSDYQFERVNDEVVLRVTRRGRRRPAAPPAAVDKT